MKSNKIFKSRLKLHKNWDLENSRIVLLLVGMPIGFRMMVGM